MCCGDVIDVTWRIFWKKKCQLTTLKKFWLQFNYNFNYVDSLKLNKFEGGGGGIHESDFQLLIIKI